MFSLLLAIALVVPIRIHGLDRDQALGQLGHRVWSAKDGLVGNITTIAQTKDGYLWVGGSEGLFRFDGQRFQSYLPKQGTLPTSEVTTLLGAADGSLWIGYSHGQIAHISNHVARLYGEAEGVPVGRVRFIRVDAAGTTWSASTGGFVRFDGTRFQRVRKDWNYSTNTADVAEIDSSGTLWVSSEGHTFYLISGERLFQSIPETTDRVKAIVPGATQVALFTNGRPDHVYLRNRPRTEPTQSLYSSHDGALLEDRDHSVWILREVGGVHRVNTMQEADHNPASLQTFSRKDGLSGAGAWTALEDMEGSIWTATERGLDQFTRRNVVARVTLVDSYGLRVVEGPDGNVWYTAINTEVPSHNFWTRIVDRKTLSRSFEGVGVPHRASDGSVWFTLTSSVQGLGTSAAYLWHWTNGGLSPLPLPSKTDETARVTALTTDAAGNPWIYIPDNGAWRFDDKAWKQVPSDNPDRDGAAFRMVGDDDGTVWMLSSTRLMKAQAGQFHVVDDHNLPAGPFNGMTLAGGEVFVLGQDGVGVGGSNGFRKILLPFDVRHAFSPVASKRSGLWFAMARGICHIPLVAIEISRHRALTEKDIEVLAASDLPESLDRSLSSSMETSNGHIWFASPTAALEIDPQRVLRNQVAPNTVIEGLITSTASFSPADDIRIAPHSGDVRIDFRSLSLLRPEANRLSFRLAPIAQDWTDAGFSHEATYGRLAPGTYHFEVKGTNNDGVWSAAPETLTFTILPAFYQTWWFRSFCVLSAGILLYLIYLFRVRQVLTRENTLAEARYAERERIARDLHDSLLGEVQGLAIRVGTLVDITPNADPLRKGLERTLKVAQEVMKSGRERVKDLRDSTITQEGFVAQIQEVGQRYAQDYSSTFAFHTSGFTTRRLNPTVASEIYQMLAEGLSNAFRHSGSREIKITLSFGKDRFSAAVIDTGCGFDRALWSEKAQSHFGLSGMQERAREISAELTLQSSPKGTTLSLNLSAERFYHA